MARLRIVITHRVTQCSRLAGKCLISQVSEKARSNSKAAAEEQEAKKALPTTLAQGQSQNVLDVETLEKKTRSSKTLFRGHAPDRNGNSGQDVG